MSEAITFERGGSTYRVRSLLNTEQQFEVARKFGMVLSTIAQMREGAVEDRARGLCAMSAEIADGDVNRVKELCLSTVDRKQGEMWAPVWAAGGGLMFNRESGFDLMTMMVAMLSVLEVNRLPDFFVTSPSGSGAPKAK